MCDLYIYITRVNPYLYMCDLYIYQYIYIHIYIYIYIYIYITPASAPVSLATPSVRRRAVPPSPQRERRALRVAAHAAREAHGRPATELRLREFP